jgi:hypothetical protein
MALVSSRSLSLRRSWFTTALVAAVITAPAISFAASSTYYVGGSSIVQTNVATSAEPVLAGFMQANLALPGGASGVMHAETSVPEPTLTAVYLAAIALGVACFIRRQRLATA